MRKVFYLSIIILSLLLSCNSIDDNNDSTELNKTIQKLSVNDYFKNTIVKSQFILIDNSSDNIIESSKGNIFIIEAGTFVDRNGQTVSDNIQIEFAEATEIDELILSNLVLQDSKNNFEQYSSFYINATRNGEQLSIASDKSIYIELFAKKQPLLIKGNRDSIGNMKWEKEISSVKDIIPVPFELLNFYPTNFEIEVEKGMPYRNHKFSTKELCDSFYYSFSTELDKNGKYNWNSLSGYNGLLMINLSLPILELFFQDIVEDNIQVDTISNTLCGINPASIKTIRTKKFQNTLLSSREFEQRLKVIYKTCDNRVLELYVQNLNKNLWEIDEMAAKYLGSGNLMYSQFKEFASYNQTTVKISNKRAELLSEYYSKEKSKIEKELLKLKTEFIKNKKKEQEISEQKKEEYKQLLQKRLKYRMNKFGFELNEFGWYNVARKVYVEELNQFDLNTIVENGDNYDRVYTYVINPKINSIFSLASDDKIHFDKVFSYDPILLLWKEQMFDIISIGYKGEEASFKTENYQQQPVVNANLILENKTLSDLKNELKKYTRNYTNENKIIVDLEYQAFFYKQEIKKKAEQKDLEFRNNLRKVIFPCCDFNTNNEIPTFPME